MVGVPRSKGCRICVQRRVKCDQARPTCNNCKKGNRPCPGYSQDLKFQDEGARLRRRFENPGFTPADTDSSRDSTDSPPDYTGSSNSSVLGQSSFNAGSKEGKITFEKPGDVIDWDVTGLDVQQTQRRTFLGLLEGKAEAYALLGMDLPEYTYNVPKDIDNLFSSGSRDRYVFKNFGDRFLSPPNMINEHILAPDIAQTQLVTAFQKSLYPDDGTLPAYLKHHTRWLSHLPPLTGTNPLLDAAVRAVTLVHIGRLNNSEPFVMESRPYYGQALRLLNKTLQDREKGVQNETLCAVILLSFYEMFASDNNESWVRHAGGVSALMRARGAARHRHGLDREVFLAYRYMLIIEAFQQDVPCFLAEPDWIDLSNTIHNDLRKTGVLPERIAIFDLAEEYYQSMVVLPAQAADARVLWEWSSTTTAPPISQAQLLDSMTRSRAKFKTTFSQFEAALKKAGHAPTIKLTNNDPLISIAYEYVNTFVSSTYVGYWTVLTVFNKCVAALQTDDYEIRESYRIECKENALNICRSTPYMLTSSFLGPFFLIFGLRTSLLVYEDEDGPEPDWILRKLFEIGDKHMSIAKHVPGYRTGITADQLIVEFKAKKAEAKAKNSIGEDFNFAKQVAYGDLSGGIDLAAMNEETTDFVDMSGGWEAFNQTEDVLQAWDNQDNFPILEMNKLNVTNSGANSGGAPRQASPMPPMTHDPQISGSQFAHDTNAFSMPDMEYWNQDWNDMPLPDQSQAFVGGQTVHTAQDPKIRANIVNKEESRFISRRAQWNGLSVKEDELAR